MVGVRDDDADKPPVLRRPSPAEKNRAAACSWVPLPKGEGRTVEMPGALLTHA
jgi:hypothetical protein